MAQTIPEHELIGASACLAGMPCRYDGKSKPNALVQKLYSLGRVHLICPEQWGGLSTPRTPAGLTAGDGNDVWEQRSQVVNRQGEDVTEQFCLGAMVAARSLSAQQIKTVILKEHSPSCGVHSTGGSDGRRRSGCGVTCALLLKSGFQVISDEELPPEN